MEPYKVSEAGGTGAQKIGEKRGWKQEYWETTRLSDAHSHSTSVVIRVWARGLLRVPKIHQRHFHNNMMTIICHFLSLSHKNLYNMWQCHCPDIMEYVLIYSCFLEFLWYFWVWMCMLSQVNSTCSQYLYCVITSYFILPAIICVTLKSSNKLFLNSNIFLAYMKVRTFLSYFANSISKLFEDLPKFKIPEKSSK